MEKLAGAEPVDAPDMEADNLVAGPFTGKERSPHAKPVSQIFYFSPAVVIENGDDVDTNGAPFCSACIFVGRNRQVRLASPVNTADHL
eukprot:356330-Chlamydomonas_euryale.AAC.6